MRPLAATEIAGTWGTLLLPINGDESIDFKRLEDELDYLVNSPLAGLYSGGTAGEFYALTEAEFDRVNELFAAACERVGKPFQIGATHTSAQVTLERVKRAAALRPGAIQVILPDWFPLSDDEILGYLERVAEACAPVPLILYNPPHAKRVLGPEEYERLARAVPGLAGVKVGGADGAWYDAMRRHMRGLSVFVPGHSLATGFRQGAHGSYSNVACLHPVGAQRWWELMQSDIDAAVELEGRIQRFMQEHIVPFARQGYANQALDKLLAAIGGWADVGTRVRWPYRSIDEAEAGRLRDAARALIPEVLL